MVMKNRLRRFLSFSVMSVAVLAACLCPRPARADDTSTRIVHQLAAYFLGVGGYWFTDSTAFRALGSPKFGGTARFFVRPARRGIMEITGGLEVFSASDHWLPF